MRARPFRYLYAGVLMIGVLAGSVLPPTASAGDEIKVHTGIVREVQLIHVSALGEPAFLILSLKDDISFLLPGQRQIAASAGVKVAVRYLPPAQVDVPGVACTIQVLGLPIVLEGEEVLHRAQRPFEIYRNGNPDCLPHDEQSD